VRSSGFGLFDELGGPPDLREKFLEYHRDNAHIYRAFCKYAQEALDAGRKYLGAGMIFERLRWYTLIEARGDGFKLNNNYRAFYARLWMREHPDRADFFRTRKQTYKEN